MIDLKVCPAEKMCQVRVVNTFSSSLLKDSLKYKEQSKHAGQLLILRIIDDLQKNRLWKFVRDTSFDVTVTSSPNSKNNDMFHEKIGHFQVEIK